MPKSWKRLQGYGDAFTGDVTGKINNVAVSTITNTVDLFTNANSIATASLASSLQVGSTLTVDGTLYVSENIRHSGNTTNYINFTADTQKFYTDNALALTLDSHQGATFAGDVEIASTKTLHIGGGNGVGILNVTQPSGTSMLKQIVIDTASTAQDWAFGTDGVGAYIDFVIQSEYTNNSWTEAMRIAKQTKAVTFAGNVKISSLGAENDLALKFGDGNTGFYESADNTLRIVTGGLSSIYVTSTVFGGLGQNQPTFNLSNNVSATVPSFYPRSSDTNTGIGSNGQDDLSLIAGGTEVLRLEPTLATFAGSVNSTGLMKVQPASGTLDMEGLRLENDTHQIWLSIYRGGSEKGRLSPHNSDIRLSAQDGNSAWVVDDSMAAGMEIADGGDATFTGNLTVDGTGTHSFDGMVQAKRGFQAGQALDIEGNTFGRTNSSSVAFGYRQDGSGNLMLLENSTGADMVTITNTGDATFAGTINSGAITSSGHGSFSSIGTSGMWVANVYDAGSSAYSRIQMGGTSKFIKFYTDGETSSDLCLTLDSSHNATFAGDITVSGGNITTTSVNGLYINGANIGDGNSSGNQRIGGEGRAHCGGYMRSYGGNALGKLEFYTGTSGNGTLALTINSSQNATFAGDVTVADDFEVSGNTIIKNDFEVSGDSYFNGGDVGIGTSSPGTILHIKGAGDKFRVDASDGTQILQIQEQSGQIADIIGPGNKDIYINKNSSGDVAIAAGGGNVGIGTTSPDVLLDVGDSDHGSAGNTGIQIQNSQAFATGYDGTNSNTFAGIQTVNHDDTSNRTPTGLTFVHRSTSSGIASILSTSKEADRADLRFITRGSDGINERMIIDSSGNVGIGTASPSYGLDVLYGTKETKLQVRNGGIYTHTQHNGGTPAFHIVDSDSDASRCALNVQSNAGSTNILYCQADGKVGIGTTSPGYPLSVSTSTAGRAIYVAQTYGSGTVYGALVEAEGSATTNIGLLCKASNATNNYALIASTGNVGIGTTSPAQLFEIKGSSADAYLQRWVSSDNATVGGFYEESDTSGRFFVCDAGGTIAVQLDSGGDSYFNGGNVGIGETSPLGKLHIKAGETDASPSTGADELVLEGTGDMGISFLSAISGAGIINFGDSNDNNIGSIEYQHGSNSMKFTTNTVAGLTIDSSQNATFGGNVVAAGSIKVSTTGGGRILNEVASATNPTLTPRNDQSATGIGGVGTSLYIISNGTTNSTYSGTTATFAGDVEVTGKVTAGNDAYNANPDVELAVFGRFYCDTYGYPFIVHDSSAGDNLFEVDGGDCVKIDPEGNLGATEFGGGITIDGQMSGVSNMATITSDIDNSPTIYVDDDAPSGGSSGDIWLEY